MLRRHVDTMEQARLDIAEQLAEALHGLGEHHRLVETLGAEPDWAQRPNLAIAYVGALAFCGRQADALAAADAHRVALGERGLDVSATMRQVTDDVARYGRPRIDVTRMAGTRTASSEALRRILVHAPTLDEVPGDVGERVEYQLAILQGLNDPSLAHDTATWLSEMRRHEAGVLEVLDDVSEREATPALALAVAYARFWDWSGQHHRLRTELSGSDGPTRDPGRALVPARRGGSRLARLQLCRDDPHCQRAIPQDGTCLPPRGTRSGSDGCSRSKRSSTAGVLPRWLCNAVRMRSDSCRSTGARTGSGVCARRECARRARCRTHPGS